MQRSYSRYERGDIILLELPFIDLAGVKLRPVLVINSIELADDIIVLKITGTSGNHRIRISNEDLEEGKLKKESYIDCSSIFTVEKKLVIKKIGRLKEEALHRVMAKLRKILGL